MRVLSLDPGTVNFAATVTKFDLSDGFKFRIEGTTMVKTKTILKDLKDARTGLLRFADVIEPLFAQGYDAFVFERYQARGGKGTTIEAINMMAGYMVWRMRECPDVTCYLASTWKNAYNRFGDLKEQYQDLAHIRKTEKGVPHKEIHELDSALIGMYHVCKLHGIKPFEFLGNKISRERKLLNLIDRAPVLKL
jgi:hypothetical protein